jgi:serine/threonine-protein kinase HipA
VWAWLPGQTEPVPVGVCVRAGSVIRFAYGNRYLERGDRISLNTAELPLVGGWQDPLPGLTIAGCLSDAGPDSWGRTVIVNRVVGRDADLAALDDLTYLLEAGSDRIGALDFQVSRDEYEHRGDEEATLDTLMRAADLVQAGEPLPKDLERALRAGSSVGGARPKALLYDGDRRLIAKFSAARDVHPVVRMEFVGMRLAALCGLDVARVSLAKSDGRDVLLVERFDRLGDERRQLISALTLLKLPDTAPQYASYGKLAELMKTGFTDPARSRRELFGRMVFNILCGNTDDHARNHAAFWDGEMLTLTPAYDICPIPRGGGEAMQAMRLGSEDDPDRHSQVIRCVRRSGLYGLDEREARQIVERQLTAIGDHFDAVCDEAELEAVPHAALRAVMPNPYALYDFA